MDQNHNGVCAWLLIKMKQTRIGLPANLIPSLAAIIAAR